MHYPRHATTILFAMLALGWSVRALPGSSNLARDAISCEEKCQTKCTKVGQKCSDECSTKDPLYTTCLGTVSISANSRST